MAGTEQKSAPRVLIVDDDRTQAETLRDVLALEGLDASCVFDPQDALRDVERRCPEVVISDFRMPGMSGLELFREVRSREPRVTFIVMTAFGTLEGAVEAMREGVYDFVTKPVDADTLVVRIRKALDYRTLERENLDLRAAVDALRERVHIVGESRQMKDVLATVEQVSRSSATVLVQGESGTGKELVARAIHLRSDRHAGPYVKVNCAAIPDNLLEDELFGHARGAFTGAVGQRKGKFELADGGTVFLDEVGDLPLHLQPKLLRVLQEREIEPVGSNEVVPVDVRVIAATHQDLKQLVEEGRFREDLFYRLNVIPLHLPPLRERAGDVRLLAEHFLAKYREENARTMRGFTAEAEKLLEGYSWPGNVRELENCIERAVVLATGDVIDAPDVVLSGPRRSGAVDAVVDVLLETPLTLDEMERRILVAALDRCGGNLSRTARSLGLTRRALQYRVDKIREAGDDGSGEPGPEHE